MRARFLLACALNTTGEEPLSEVLTARLAAFLQHAWNPATKRFRNFMSFGRVWLEESGSEDSHGRTLWALGECARSDISPSRRQWARELFDAALPAAEDFSSPRAWAFPLLGLHAYCRWFPDNALAARPAAFPGRQADLHPRIGGKRKLDLVRGRAWLMTMPGCRKP
jgi:hypothetical protein